MNLDTPLRAQVLNISKHKTQLFKEVVAIDKNVRHSENNFVDFDRDRLIFKMISSEGPKFGKADINKDGKEDLSSLTI